MPRTVYPLLAVHVGNNRLKFGLFDGDGGQPLPEPAAVSRATGAGPRWRA